MRVFLGLRTGAPLPVEYTEWKIAFDTGWTLDYIDSLTLQDIHNYIQIRDGIAKARNT